MKHLLYQEEYPTGKACEYCAAGEIGEDGFCDRCGRYVSPGVIHLCPICGHDIDTYHCCYMDCGEEQIVYLGLDSNSSRNYIAWDQDGDLWYFAYRADYDVDKLLRSCPRPISRSEAQEIVDEYEQECHREIAALEAEIERLNRETARL